MRWVCDLAASYRPGRPEGSKNKNNISNKDCGKRRDVRMCQCPYRNCTQASNCRCQHYSTAGAAQSVDALSEGHYPSPSELELLEVKQCGPGGFAAPKTTTLRQWSPGRDGVYDRVSGMSAEQLRNSSGLAATKSGISGVRMRHSGYTAAWKWRGIESLRSETVNSRHKKEPQAE